MGANQVRSDVTARCRDCGATVTRSDRFCPACGTPNAACKFHPKFGPAPVGFEPQILVERAAEGCPACPRCGRPIQPPQDYCIGCGMRLERAWLRYQRERVVDEWQREDGPVREFRAAGLLGAGLRSGLALLSTLATMVGLGLLWRYARIQGLFEPGPSPAALARAVTTAGVVAVVLGLADAVLFVAWCHRAAANLRALAVAGPRVRPARALLGWVVPGLNLVRPKQLVDDLYRASHPRTPPFSPQWRQEPAPLLSCLWWTALWLGAAFVVAGGLLGREALAAGKGDTPAAAALYAGIAALLLAGSALSAQVLVHRVSDRQEHRAAWLVDVLGTGADAVHAEAVLTTSFTEPTGAEGAGPGPAPERRTTALRVQPSTRRPVWGKY